MAYKVIILYRLYMPSYFLGTFAEYPKTIDYRKSGNLFSDNMQKMRFPDFFYFLDNIISIESAAT